MNFLHPRWKHEEVMLLMQSDTPLREQKGGMPIMKSKYLNKMFSLFKGFRFNTRK